MIGSSILLILCLEIIGYSGSISGSPVQNNSPPPSPIRVSTSAGQIAAKLMLHEGEYEVHASSPKHQSASSPRHQSITHLSVTESEPSHIMPKSENRYQQKKRNKIAKFIQEGLHPKEAEQKFLKEMSTLQKNWASKNRQRTSVYNNKSWKKTSVEVRTRRKEYRRKSYQVKKSIIEALLDDKDKKKGSDPQTYLVQHEDRYRVNLEKGMSPSDAKEAADKYIEDVRMKSRSRRKKNHLIKAAAKALEKSNAQYVLE